MIPSNQHKPKISIRIDENFKQVKQLVQKEYLNTVCVEARCPNIYECWQRKTATLMILGDICTRSCGFCSVKTGKPSWNDPLEPLRVAHAVKKMSLRHVVITSVDRDDLKGDYGASIWAQTITQIRKMNPQCTIEVLTPDFKGEPKALNIVFEALPNIFSHNIECVERISRQIRPQANWKRTLGVLKLAKEFGLTVKTGIMVGLGETIDEVKKTMDEALSVGVEIFTIGQYLQPTKKHLIVQKYRSLKDFELLKDYGKEIGFKIIESGPLVRSSYHADEQAKLFYNNA
jgi:lipoic acid synthetase